MTNLKRLFPFIRPYRLVLYLTLITTFLPVAMELIVPQALRYVIDQGITLSDMDVIWRGSGLMLATALIGAIATLAQGYYRAQLSQGLAYDLRDKLFAHIQTLSFANLDQMQTGQLMTRLSSDVDMLRLFFSAGLALLIRTLGMIIGSVVLMALTDWQLTLVMAVLLPIAGLLLWSILRLVQPMFFLVQEKLGGLNTIVQENLAGVQVVKAFVREHYEIDRFAGFNSDYRDENINVGRLMAMALPALAILTNLGLVAVLWFGGRDAITGRLTVGELVAFNNYLLIGMAPLLLLSNVLNMVSRAEASAERVWELLDTEPAVKTATFPHVASSLQGRITFNNVAFHYNGGKSVSVNGQSDGRSGGEDVLRDLSFTVAPGQRIALLGATGSGKSSLVNLIPRFYDAYHGQICIDGVDVRDWEPEALRKRIGVYRTRA
jgi:ATP-binding cassette subfamily B protein